MFLLAINTHRALRGAGCFRDAETGNLPAGSKRAPSTRKRGRDGGPWAIRLPQRETLPLGKTPTCRLYRRV